MRLWLQHIGWWALMVLIITVSGITFSVWLTYQRARSLAVDVGAAGGSVHTRSWLPEPIDQWLDHHKKYRPYTRYLNSRVCFVGLYEKGIDDQWVERLSQFGSIEELNLANARISDSGIAPLARLSQLKILSLEGTEITDHGVEAIARLSSLTYVNLKRTKVTPKRITWLQDIRPDLRVLHY